MSRLIVIAERLEEGAGLPFDLMGELARSFVKRLDQEERYERWVMGDWPLLDPEIEARWAVGSD